MPAGHATGGGVRPLPLVLVVEDDPETRRFYQTVLRDDGFTTDAAHNGFQALEKAVNATPDLIVTDIAVPGIDGIELCRRLRADARTRDIPVLAVTGYGDRHYPDRIIRAGADRVLSKPLDPAILRAEARHLLRAAAGQPDQGKPPAARRRSHRSGSPRRG